jgi:hypothetical protein
MAFDGDGQPSHTTQGTLAAAPLQPTQDQEADESSLCRLAELKIAEAQEAMLKTARALGEATGALDQIETQRETKRRRATGEPPAAPKRTPPPWVAVISYKRSLGREHLEQ